MRLRQAELTWHVVGDDVAVLDLQGSVYLKVNGSGRLLWERLADGCTEVDLVAGLIDRFGVDEQRAIADVAAFLDQLRKRGLLTR